MGERGCAPIRSLWRVLAWQLSSFWTWGSRCSCRARERAAFPSSYSPNWLGFGDSKENSGKDNLAAMERNPQNLLESIKWIPSYCSEHRGRL